MRHMLWLLMFVLIGVVIAPTAKKMLPFIPQF